jgi:hypothetical protein
MKEKISKCYFKYFWIVIFNFHANCEFKSYFLNIFCLLGELGGKVTRNCT